MCIDSEAYRLKDDTMGVKIVDSMFHPNKRYKDDKDGLSGLPDDILVANILSALPLKEAARTSVLSPRWAHLWKLTSRLDFSLLDTEKTKEFAHTYLEFVNSVLGSLQGIRPAPPLKEFRVCISLGPPPDNQITEWLKFAFARQVESLELDNQNNNSSSCGGGSKMHVFTRELLSSCHFKTMKALRLTSVRVSQEALELFLRNCPSLEQLVVHSALNLSNLGVVSGSLKHLEMWFCYQLMSVKVSHAPKLTSLSFTPCLEALELQNVPMLVDSHLHCGHENCYLRELGPALSCCISQLELLTLSLSIPENILDCPLPVFPKLKRLVLETLTRHDETSLLELTSFMRTCPYLQEFVVMSCRFKLKKKRERNTQIPDFVQFPHHQHLKVFEFVGYSGRDTDAELVRYIVNNCVVLEKIIIDPLFRPVYFSYMVKCRDLVAEQTARDHARKQLQAEIPHHLEFVTL